MSPNKKFPDSQCRVCTEFFAGVAVGSKAPYHEVKGRRCVGTGNPTVVAK